jgi:hypothetical protein
MNENMRYLKEEQKFLEKARAEGITPARALKEIVTLMLDEKTGD